MSANRDVEMQMVERAKARAERLRRAANALKRAADAVHRGHHQPGHSERVNRLRALLDELYPVDGRGG